MKNKVIIIGIDSGTFTIIDKLIKENKLPNLKRLIQNGVKSKLKSTVQPCSEQAWSSFATGLNNGKHNIFALLKIKKNYSSRMVNALDRRGKSLWKILSEQGKRSIVINVPLTYPPEKINGIIVSGCFTPSKKSKYTYPKRLKKEIEKQVPDYIIDILPPKASFEDEKTLDYFLKKSFKTIETRYKLAAYLKKNILGTSSL